MKEKYDIQRDDSILNKTQKSKSIEETKNELKALTKKRSGRTQSIYLEDELYEIIDDIAKESGVSFSKTVNMILRKVLIDD